MTKRYHDKRLLRLEFFLGQQVLLYNSRLRLFLGKKKSKWSIPFIIKEVFFKWLFQQQYQILDFLQQQYQRLKSMHQEWKVSQSTSQPNYMQILHLLVISSRKGLMSIVIKFQSHICTIVFPLAKTQKTMLKIKTG